MVETSSPTPAQGLYLRGVAAAWALALVFILAGAVIGAVLDHHVYIPPAGAEPHRAMRLAAPPRDALEADFDLDLYTGDEAPPAG
jgi:hypothetical protein